MHSSLNFNPTADFHNSRPRSEPFRETRAGSKLNEYLEVKNISNVQKYKFPRDLNMAHNNKDVKVHKVNNLQYIINDNDTLNSVALKFNMSPNMLKQINGLSSDFIFPGQSLHVPHQTHKYNVILSNPPSSVTDYLPTKKTFFRYPMKRITRFDGAVSGTTLITSNAFMFRAHVSDELVIQNGENEYNVNIPLDSVSQILLFESFDEMLADIQTTTGTEFTCLKCAEMKNRFCYSQHPSDDENISDENISDLSFKEESVVETNDQGMIELNLDLHEYDDSAAPRSFEPEFHANDDTVEGIPLGMSPVKFSPICEHEFQGFGCKYSTKVRVNPFSIGDETNKLYVPSYTTLDVLSKNDIIGGLKRNDSDISLATKEFFQKIDENTNQTQNILENEKNHEYSIFISIHSIICSRTHGKPSYQQETDEGYKKAHFWVCISDSNVAEMLGNFSELCAHLKNVDDPTNCVMRCDEEHFKTLEDALLPDIQPTFVPREIATDLISEPFSGSLNFPPGKTKLLTMEMMGELQPYLPCHAIGVDVLLAYSMKVHGMSLKSLYVHCKPYEEVPCLLLVKDTMGYVFGAYLSHGIVESPKFYGSGETFLFSLSPEPTKCYFWQGENYYFMMGTSEYFTVGAGDGNFALYLDDMLLKGTSNRSLTFFNDVLSGSSSFDILTLEVWCFTDEIVDNVTDSITGTKLYSGGMAF